MSAIIFNFSRLHGYRLGYSGGWFKKIAFIFPQAWDIFTCVII